MGESKRGKVCLSALKRLIVSCSLALLPQDMRARSQQTAIPDPPASQRGISILTKV